jgi:hypothetical protein
MGVLIQLEGTRSYRLALLPVTLYLAGRAAFVDMSGGDPTNAQMDSMLVMTFVLGCESVDGIRPRLKCVSHPSPVLGLLRSVLVSFWQRRWRILGCSTLTDS